MSVTHPISTSSQLSPPWAGPTVPECSQPCPGTNFLTLTQLPPDNSNKIGYFAPFFAFAEVSLWQQPVLLITEYQMMGNVPSIPLSLSLFAFQPWPVLSVLLGDVLLSPLCCCCWIGVRRCPQEWLTAKVQQQINPPPKEWSQGFIFSNPFQSHSSRLKWNW